MGISIRIVVTADNPETKALVERRAHEALAAAGLACPPGHHCQAPKPPRHLRVIAASGEQQ
jgi:hypothetical protein